MNDEVSESELKSALQGWKYGNPMADWSKYKGEYIEDSAAENPVWAHGTTWKLGLAGWGMLKLHGSESRAESKSVLWCWSRRAEGICVSQTLVSTAVL
jgi:hypothetical protein